MELPDYNLIVNYSENCRDFDSSHLENASYWLGIIYKDEPELLTEGLVYVLDLLIAANTYRQIINKDKCTINDVANTMKKVLDKHTEPVKITNDTLNTRPWYIKSRW